MKQARDIIWRYNVTDETEDDDHFMDHIFMTSSTGYPALQDESTRFNQERSKDTTGSRDKEQKEQESQSTVEGVSLDEQANNGEKCGRTIT